MKRNFVAFMALALFIVSCATAKPEATAADNSMQDGLDAAIRNASDYINKNVPRGSKLVILNVKSTFTPLSEYIIDVLTGNVVNDRVFTVVDRANLALIQQEMDFQLSGEVSDESLQTIGQKLGAQTIVSGSITPFGNLWRLTIRALGVEDATVLGLYNENIPSSSTLAALTSGTETVETARNQTVASKSDTVAASNTGTASGTQPVTSVAQLSDLEPAAPPANIEYKVGNKGPSGGWIFYDKGRVLNGWRYLEAAPKDEPTAEWGAYGKTVGGTATGVGAGERNTELILEFLKNSTREVGRAAQFCEEQFAGKFDDWFLPSKDELNLMYQNLKVKGLGGFGSGVYWSSSEIGSATSWIQDFKDGNQMSSDNWVMGDARKNNTYSIRAIRQF
jgi:TolB-like protein